MLNKVNLIFLLLFVLIISFLSYFFYNKFSNLKISENAVYVSNKVYNSIVPNIFENKPDLKVEDNTSIYLSEDTLKKNYSDFYTVNNARNIFQKYQNDLKALTDPELILDLKMFMSYMYPNTEIITDRVPRTDKTFTSYNNFYEIRKESLLLKPENEKLNLKGLILQYFYLTYEESCFDYATLYKSSWSEHPVFIDSNKRYPNNKQLATHIAFDSLLKGENRNDKFYILNRTFIVARILDNFESELTKDDREYFISELKNLMKASENAKYTNVFVGNARGVFLPNIYQAFSFAVLSKYDESITKQMVLDNYNQKVSLFKSTLYGKDDPLASYIAWLQGMHLKYLYENNGKIVNEDTKIVSKDLIVNAQNAYTGSIAEVEKFFFQNTQTEMGSWDKARTNLVEVAKKDKDLKVFLESFGLKI